MIMIHYMHVRGKFLGALFLECENFTFVSSNLKDTPSLLFYVFSLDTDKFKQ